MDLKLAKITLEKINDLFHSLERDSSNVSSIERDLMRGYIQQFYEHFISGAAAGSVPEAPARDKAPVRRNYTPPRIIEIPDAPRDFNSTPKPEPTRRPNPEPEPRPQPRPEPQPKPEPRPTPPPQRPEPTPEPPKPEPVKVAEPISAASNRQEVPGNLRHLFAFKEATELSEKLSERPVHDLTKALAINDRLLYMNELFGRDLNALNDTLGKLNQLNNMDEAQGLIVQMAQRYDWAADDKEDTAKDFIRLIRRKYQ
ncbi:MAG: hypothetical protein RIC19_06705 [Phaeodactylibacter sp.]|uniref:hypothetical protein n=1 Tax=Phaeodactylibacter sp. TaxID=1940289 RepID=UPI0032F089C6